MAIEIVSFPIKNGGSFHSYVKLPEGTVLPKNIAKSGSKSQFHGWWGLAGWKFQGNHKWVGRAVNFPRHQWSWSWPNSIPSQSEIMAQFDALKLILTKIQNQTLEPYPDPHIFLWIPWGSPGPHPAAAPRPERARSPSDHRSQSPSAAVGSADLADLSHLRSSSINL